MPVTPAPDAQPQLLRERWAGYDALMLGFSLLAIGMLVVGVAVELGPSSRSILAYADTAVCLVFLTDFVVSLMRAENRWRYMLSWGWLDLISAIPVFDSVRWGRAARVVRVLRVIRGVKAILAFEEGGSGSIKTADDAVWWAICTVTTVGYGDYYPVTWEGRVVAFFLMITGAATFGALAGLLASWFMGTEDAADKDELREVREELACLRLLLESRLGPETHLRAFEGSAGSGRDGCVESPYSKAA
jgi:voltage-gated potassium channel